MQLKERKKEGQSSLSNIFTMDPAPPLDPSKPSIPVSYPIMTLEDLASRSYFKSFHYPYNRSSVPIESSVLDSRPRILVCHDMHGGYVDDKWVQGGTNPDAYAIWHWYLIDVFVYFSHYLVTLPPPCWTNTAHRHGVKVLGTFITEGDVGRTICNKLLSTKESADMYADLLVELAVALGFDGWLLNFEIELDKGQIPILKEFISYLTQTMHSKVPGSLVIWYDSVTVDGELLWQNQLNDKNKLFFDNCDGIFVNYTWEEDYPKLSAAVAGDRKHDVYMGIDTNVALDVLKKDDVSAAIFAPGWVKETAQPPDFETAQNQAVDIIFLLKEDKCQMLPGIIYHHKAFSLHLPLMLTQLQTLFNFKEASYSGGGNITFKGTLGKNTDFTARIFQGNLRLGELPLYLTYSVKSSADSLLGLSLHFSSPLNDRTSVLVASRGGDKFSRKFSKVIVPHRVNNAETAPEWHIQESSIEMNGYTLTEIRAVCYRPEPEHSGLASHTSHGHDDTIVGSPPDYFAVLGHLTVRTSKENPYFPPSSSWLVKGQYIKWTSGSQGSKTLSMEISWKLKDGNDSPFQKYNIYVDHVSKQETGNPGGRLKAVRQYIGEANMEAFYISELSIPSSTSSLKFIIQACSVDGAIQKLDDSPFFQLNVEAPVIAEEGTVEMYDYSTEKHRWRASWTSSRPEWRYFGIPSDWRFDSLLSKRSDTVVQGLLKRELQSSPSKEKKLLSTDPPQEPSSSTVDHPPFDPSEPSTPVSYPIKTLEELASRAYFDSFHYPFNKSSVPLHPSSVSLPDRRRLLVCHDMQGGYVDDRWVQGGTNPDAYAIWNWYLIDVFVYFSHCLVTLPPPCWTNTAHRHGVKVLGTFITEWDEGRLICDQLLATEESARMYAERLAELAASLGFDGWLINVENKLSQSQIPILQEFISHLTQIMHSSVPGSLVIWYDSVTTNGDLKWQDQLNEKNKPFFDICDGIFVNYTWKENYPRLSAVAAGDRRFDVYMGIDTSVALDVIKKENVSAAIFAPGWVYETKHPPDFHNAQNRWWALVEKSWGRVNDNFRLLPFYSNFDQGRGHHVSFQGAHMKNDPWNNLSCQGVQVKLEGDSLLGIALEFSSTLNERASVLIAAPWGINQAPSKFSKVIMSREIRNPETASEWRIFEGTVAMDGHTLREIHAVCYRPKTERSELRSKNKEDGQEENASNPNPGKYYTVLGHITVKRAGENSFFLPSTSWLVEGQHIKFSSDSEGSKTVSVKLIWRRKDGNDLGFQNYHVHVKKLGKQADGYPVGEREGTLEFLGVAQVEAFYVSNLAVPSDTKILRFIVQACAADGTFQKLEDCPYFQLDV
ncbi:hypothetical protein Tsubulata_046325 [Turnera subulata]|uniref:mannosyl-glycoprotein endo-beta-N-acetylglucosaminidase n=1 Tax=Turnera subulata TaxID=218843 RepID=A0A9Q0J4S0_9ROSI|nr:hypothetical protein Tsubulata_046325 [Turnera subulata]